MNTAVETEVDTVTLINIMVDYLEKKLGNANTLEQLRKDPIYPSFGNFGETTLRTLFIRLKNKCDHTTLLLLGDLLGDKCLPSENGHVEKFDMCAKYLKYGFEHGYLNASVE